MKKKFSLTFNLILLTVSLVLTFYINVINGDDGFDEGPIVKVAQGQLKGLNLQSRDGRDYKAFLNVPYGTANRFENPEPVGPWEGIYDASKMGEECAQSFWFTYELSGVEDCLKFNIYSPNLQGNYPVMVYFHGGGFTIGTANYYHADYFMDEDVVLVIVNYRLGPFGFLSTGDEIISGNFGLKDQTMALRFVAENIAQFGGNPDSVTLFGNSAGGASVNYHLLSPLSKGLFSGAISQSGSVFNPWAYTKPPQVIANKFAHVLNCPSDSQSLLSCLRNKSTKEILSGMELLNEWGYDPFSPFAPTVEQKHLPGAFLTETPDVLMETGKFNQVPWLMGMVQDEGILMHSGFILHHKHLTSDLKANWTKIFPITLEYNNIYGNIPQRRQDEATEKIYKFYFDEKSIGEETRQELTDMFSDRFFNHGVKKAAILAAKHVPVYMYMFAHNRQDFTTLELLGITGNFGTAHADELTFLFSQTFDVAPDLVPGSNAEKVSKHFVKLWVSFAKNKQPTALWGSVTSVDPINQHQIDGQEPLKYLWIDEKLSVQQEKFTHRLDFWNHLIENYLHDDPIQQKQEL